jgi:protein-S-isoprenylcysteine O-methyltransferase Ste14
MFEKKKCYHVTSNHRRGTRRRRISKARTIMLVVGVLAVMTGVVMSFTSLGMKDDVTSRRFIQLGIGYATGGLLFVLFAGLVLRRSHVTGRRSRR